MTRSFFVASCILAAACSSPPPAASPARWPAGDVVDLSHTYDQQTVFWPTAESFRLEKVADGITDKGYYYAANNFCTSEHGGTHLDAPVHFAQGHQTVDQVPLERLVGEAVVIDVSAESEKDVDYQVAVGDFTRWEQAHGQLPSGAIVLIRTGFSRRWPDAARWLVANRSIDAIGLDTASIDYGRSTLFESHRILYERNIPAFENLTNLDRLPATGAYVVALPMKIGGGSGAPLRAIAILGGS